MMDGCHLLLIVHFAILVFAGNSWQIAETSQSFSDNIGFRGQFQVAPIDVTNGTIGSKVNGYINSSIILVFNYNYNVTENDVLVVSVQSNVKDLNEPLLISTWTQWDALAWRLPWRMDTATGSVMFHEINRTMCPREVVTPPKVQERKKASNSTIVILSTYSKSNILFNLTVDWKGSFRLRPGNDISVIASPVSPAFVRVTPPENGVPFLIRANSADDTCMTVAIRNLMCEAFNEFSSPKLQYDGYWQSATTQASITVDPLRFPNGILMEIFIEADDSLCKSFSASRDKNRVKQIQFTVLTLPRGKNLAAAFAIPSVLLLAVGLSALAIVYVRIRLSSRVVTSYESLRPETGVQADDGRTEMASTSTGPLIQASDLWQSLLTQRELTKPSLADVDQAFKDKVPTEPATYRQTLLLAAFSHILAALPLAISGLREFNITGNQDTCAFNFRCAVPWGPIPDINHVFSNLGYIVFGFVLLVVTYIESEHWTNSLSSAAEVRGIVPQFGLFWCLAINLVAAGIVGGAYHLCPSKLSYELDMSFLYALVLHMMLSLYRRRHPNFGVSLPSMWKTWAAIEAAALGGLHTEGVWGEDTFWTFWTMLHMGLVIFLSVHIYYAGVVNLNKEDVVRILRWQLSRDHTNVRLLFPLRFFLLLLGLVVNVVFAFYGAITQPPDVPAYVLLLLIFNLLFYTIFYVSMKCRSGERLTVMTWTCLVVALLTWILALIVFSQPSITWESTPARSRAVNSDCSYLGLYDSHDIWHFLSSAALFFMCLAFINLDNDLRIVPYEKITVF